MKKEDRIEHAVIDMLLLNPSWHELAFQERSGQIKSFYIAIGQKAFRVLVNGRVLYVGDDAHVAVDCYNHAFADLENPIISPSSGKTKA